jgi:hypothetical protein
MEQPMNEETINLGIRKFLKQFGVSAQREIERALQAAERSGQLPASGVVQVAATLRIAGATRDFTIEGEIPLN